MAMAPAWNPREKSLAIYLWIAAIVLTVAPWFALLAVASLGIGRTVLQLIPATSATGLVLGLLGYRSVRRLRLRTGDLPVALLAIGATLALSAAAAGSPSTGLGAGAFLCGLGLVAAAVAAILGSVGVVRLLRLP